MPNLFTPSKNNPIIAPNPRRPWESEMAYNPAAILEHGHYHLLYRAVGGAWVSKLGHATSTDGEHFLRRHRPVFHPELPQEKNGVEDPRVTKIGDAYYMTYTAYDGSCARLFWARSRDLDKWERLGPLLPDWDARRAHEFVVDWDSAQHNFTAERQWHKAGGIFSEKIRGGYWMLFGDRHLWLAHSLDLKNWTAIYHPFVMPRPGYFDHVHVEMGPPPLLTDKGWLVIYHGVDRTITYRLGYLLLDAKDPRHIIKRSEEPVFEPAVINDRNAVNILPGGMGRMELMAKNELDNLIAQAEAEKILPRVVFTNGAVIEGGRIRIYYGIGDKEIGTAVASIDDILAST